MTKTPNTPVETDATLLPDPKQAAETSSAVSEMAKSSSKADKPVRLGRSRVYARRFMRNITAVIGLAIFAVLAVFSIVGEHLTRWKIDTIDWDLAELTAGPSLQHWFGTKSGFDVYVQTAHGLSRSLFIGVGVSVASVLISAFVGASAAYFGGVYEKAILWLIHFLMVIPSFLILALITNGSGGKIGALMLAMISLGWMSAARVIWSLSISIREREFVSAARYMGVSGVKTVWRHIVPNIGSLLVLHFAFGITGAIMGETALSFLGFGIKPPDVSLGAMIGDGTNLISSAPHAFYFPAGILTLLTVSSAFVADGLRDALDPNSSAGGRA